MIRRRSISASIAPGSNSRWIVTVAPAASAGVVRMFSGPVLNSGPLVSTSSAGSTPTAAATFSALKCSIAWVSTAPLVGPVVPDVLMISSGVSSARSGSQDSSGAPLEQRRGRILRTGRPSARATRRPRAPSARTRPRRRAPRGSVFASTTASSGAGIRALSGTRIAPMRAHANSRSSSSGAFCPRYATRSPAAISSRRASAPASRATRPSIARVADLPLLEADRDLVRAALRPPGHPARDLRRRGTHAPAYWAGRAVAPSGRGPRSSDLLEAGLAGDSA